MSHEVARDGERGSMTKVPLHQRERKIDTGRHNAIPAEVSTGVLAATTRETNGAARSLPRAHWFAEA